MTQDGGSGSGRLPARCLPTPARVIRKNRGSERLCATSRGPSPPPAQIRPRVPGRLGKAQSRTESMYVDKKSDEAILPAKRLNKGRQLPAEVVEGRASPKGNSR